MVVKCMCRCSCTRLYTAVEDGPVPLEAPAEAYQPVVSPGAAQDELMPV